MEKPSKTRVSRRSWLHNKREITVVKANRVAVTVHRQSGRSPTPLRGRSLSSDVRTDSDRRENFSCDGVQYFTRSLPLLSVLCGSRFGERRPIKGVDGLHRDNQGQNTRHRLVLSIDVHRRGPFLDQSQGTWSKTNVSRQTKTTTSLSGPPPPP